MCPNFIPTMSLSLIFFPFDFRFETEKPEAQTWTYTTLATEHRGVDEAYRGHQRGLGLLLTLHLSFLLDFDLANIQKFKLDLGYNGPHSVAKRLNITETRGSC